MTRQETNIALGLHVAAISKGKDGKLIADKEEERIKGFIKQERYPATIYDEVLAKVKSKIGTPSFGDQLIEEVKTLHKHYRREAMGIVVVVGYEDKEQEETKYNWSDAESAFEKKCQEAWKIDHDDVMKSIHQNFNVK